MCLNIPVRRCCIETVGVPRSTHSTYRQIPILNNMAIHVQTKLEGVVDVKAIDYMYAEACI